MASSKQARGRGLTKSGEVRPEFIFLGLLLEAPGHGYDLAKRFKSSLAGLWRLSESQLYATLGRLEAKGLIEGAAEPARGDGRGGADGEPRAAGESRAGRGRRELRATPAGREAFFSWLRTSGDAHPRSLRLEFLTRLYFAERLEPSRYDAVVRGQRDALALALAEAEARAAGLASEAGRVEAAGPEGERLASALAAEAAAFSAGQFRAALDWLDGLARRPRGSAGRPAAGPGESGPGGLS